ncbi:hypothetical protein Barb6_00304 [Bacteroidales bacterium Barb6]|nr:hypothetical protein Barb6_00304 [Bacteroidales bacterium Barb6]
MRLHTHPARPENLLRRPYVKLHIGNIERLACLPLKLLLVLLAEIRPQRLLHTVILILLRRKHDRRRNLHLTDAGANHIHSRPQVILHRCLHILRTAQVRRRLSDKVLILLRHGLRHRITGNGILRYNGQLLRKQRLPAQIPAGHRIHTCGTCNQAHPQRTYPDLLPCHILIIFSSYTALKGLWISAPHTA